MSPCRLALFAMTLLPAPVAAMYIRPDLENIPVNRLIANLEKHLKDKPQDSRVRFHLARLYAMSYALKSDTVQIRKNKELEGAWFGYEPRPVPFTVKPSNDPEKVKTAREHLNKALALYGEVVKANPDDLIALLGQAWCIEQLGDKEKTIATYRAVIDKAWAKESQMKVGPLGWHPVTAEAANYLIPLLDAEKDKKEIETLKERAKKLRMLPRPITPIAVPLRDGLTARDVLDERARVAFDADGSGLRRRWTWITSEAAWLVLDRHGRKQVDSALQLFGSVTFWTFWENGYQALAALDDDRDGRLAGKELAGLALWHDANGNGVCDPGEVRPLAEWGIVALSCRCEKGKDGSHVAFSPQGVMFKNGKVRPTWDLILRLAE